nr:MAG TPA: hypothetical protein [Caudoviricetes sp.]DAN23235.1 MAG TPA_asm: hypothetical protein [Bacteriophage sp.]
MGYKHLSLLEHLEALLVFLDLQQLLYLFRSK